MNQFNTQQFNQSQFNPFTLTTFPPPILWDKATCAYGLIIHVNNPGMFPLDHALIESLVNQILPAHVKVFYEFE